MVTLELDAETWRLSFDGNLETLVWLLRQLSGRPGKALTAEGQIILKTSEPSASPDGRNASTPLRSSVATPFGG